MPFHFVYILASERGGHRLVGSTENLAARLKKHNGGGVPHTAKFKPWKIETAIAFRSREKASQYEVYLKSHSGREYAKRHF